MALDEDHVLETYRSLVIVSMEGLKTLLLINGGAVVAILAFLGQAPQGPQLASHAWLPLGLFVGGVGCCGMAFVGSYFTQLVIYNESILRTDYHGPSHSWFLWATVVLVLASFICFAGGAFSSVVMFANYVSP